MTKSSQFTTTTQILTSRLDYCNSILYMALPTQFSINFNMFRTPAARLLTSTRRYEHITSVLRNLHWLPVK